MTTTQLPAWAWQTIKVFLAAEKTGKVSFVINQGHVQAVEVMEYLKGERPLDEEAEKRVR